MAASTTLNGAKKRLYLLGALLFFWVLLVVGRLVILQVFQYGTWKQRAEHEQQRSIEVSPRRGIIYDRNGQELAMSVMVDSWFAVPTDIPDKPTAASLLAKVLDVNPHEMLARLEGGKTFCWIARKVDADTSQRIRALNLRGVYPQKEPKRFYPKGQLGAKVLGYVGMDDAGLGGIENNYDDSLRGIPGKMLISMDAKRRWFGRVERQPDPGENIVLTLDENIQHIVEREIETAFQETHALAATVIVQNPRTGEILALANRPTFNPNTFQTVPAQALKNRAVSDVFEPGSTFKLITISASLEEKLATPDDLVDCQMGSIVVGGMRIHDHERLGMLTVTQILEKSSDVGAIKLGMRLGEERLYKYIRAYGLGAQTGIELPGETRGLAKPVNRWSKVSIGAISMGQEIGVSALQLISVVSTIANDGIYTPPRILIGSTQPRDTAQRISFRMPEQHRVVSPMTAVQMKKMMEGVVLFGTGRKAILDGYTSAGKTGTAQKVDPATGAYSRTKYVGSFVGFAPVNNPAITVVVIIDSAQGLHQGGQVSAPVFQRICQQVLAYLNVPNDLEPKNKNRLSIRANVKDQELEEGSPDHLGAVLELSPDPAPAPLSRAPATMAYMPSPGPQLLPAAGRMPQSASRPALPGASATQQPATPAANPGALSPETAAVPAGATVIVDVTGGAVVPNLVGKSLRAAVEAAQEAGIDLDAQGFGIAREQIPAPGTRVAQGARVAVRFAR